MARTVPDFVGQAPTAARSLAGAAWIRPVEGTPVPAPGKRPAYLLRRSFNLDARIGLTLHATAHGIYEFFLNGKRVGDQELTPGFTAYRKRLAIQSYDLDALLITGRNTLVAILSDGWFRGRHGFQRRPDGFGDKTALLAAITDRSGEPIVSTDGSWCWRRSHILRADLMDGQVVDFQQFDPRWFTGSDDNTWQPVEEAGDPLCADRTRLIAPEAAPVRRIAEIAPAAISYPRPGTVVVDLGQNINGWMRIRDLGPAGTHLVLTHGEVLDESGLVNTDHLRSFNFATKELLPVGQIDHVISGGRSSDIFEPRHTTHGFRFVQIDGVPQSLDLSTARGVLVHSDLTSTGDFSCSDKDLEHLHEVVRWSFRGNACAVPTDCPQRERSGFTGDWQIFVATAALMMDVSAFSDRWLRDLAADQWSDGRIPTIVPNPGGDQPSGQEFEDLSAGSAGWGDAAVIVPWELWRAYGDPTRLAGHYPAMKRWVDYAANSAASGRNADRAAARPDPEPYEKYLWDTGFHFGEWLEPGIAPETDPQTDHGIVATAYLHRSARIAAATARILGFDDEAVTYQEIADGAAEAWRAEYVHSDGSLTEERQAHYVRALAFELIPDRLREATADRLAQLVHANDDRLNTGFLATAMLLQALADNNHGDVAHRLLSRRGEPSWLGMLDAGATTMWEYWDGIAADGKVTGSLNHYSKGAVASFLHTHVAGLRLPAYPGKEQAGYRRVLIEPLVLPGITSASTVQETPIGRVSVSWHRESGTFFLALDLPAATTAEIVLPDGGRKRAGGGRSDFACELASP